MRKNLPFLTGMAAMALLLALIPTSLAAPEQTAPMNGKIAVNQVGIALSGEVKTPAGQTLTAANGQRVPTVLTYTDALGGKTHYLAAQTAAELFDVYRGVSWNAEKNCIDFAKRPKANIVVVEPGKEPPKNLPDGSITIAVGTGDENGKKPDAAPTKPELGRKAGPFTEVNAASVNMDRRPIVLKDGRLSQSATGLDQMVYIEPANGTTIVITLTNHGKSKVYMSLMRPYTVGNGYEELSGVGVAPGKSVVRAIRMDKEAEELQRILRLVVNPQEMGWMTDVSFAVEQFKE